MTKNTYRNAGGELIYIHRNLHIGEAYFEPSDGKGPASAFNITNTLYHLYRFMHTAIT